jgi:hypothetical protein
VAAHKRFIILAALTAMFTVGWAADSQAQRRYRRPVRAAVVVAPYYYSPYYRPFWGYDPWFPDYQWGGIYGPYGPYRYYNVDPGGSMRLEVKPREAEVYVDGYYAGVVDDFDGTFQRLRVPPGEHEIALYLEGYRTVREKIYLLPDKTFKLNRDLEPLPAGEPPEARPQPLYPPQSGAAGGPGAGQPPYGPPPGPRGQAGRRGQPPQAPPQQAPPGARDPRDSRAPESPAYGTLSVRVQPGGAADVVVDGEKWRGPEGQERIFIELPEGRHTVEIQKQGFRTYVTDVDVRRGETTELNVSLRNQE